MLINIYDPYFIYIFFQYLLIIRYVFPKFRRISKKSNNQTNDIEIPDNILVKLLNTHTNFSRV